MKKIIYFLLLMGIVIQANDSYKILNGKRSNLKRTTRYIALKTKTAIPIQKLKDQLFLLNIPEIEIIKKLSSDSFVIKFKSELQDSSIFKGYEILPSYNYSDNKWPLVTDKRIIVKFKDGISDSVKEQIFNKYNLIVSSKFYHDKNAYRLDCSNDAFKVANELFNLGIFDYSYPDYYIMHTLYFYPNDTYYDNQWHLKSGRGGVDAEAAWDINKGSSSVRISIVDNGMDLNHEDLNIIAYHDYSARVADFNDAGDHGTACAGVAAASGNNNKGVTGLCMNCSILAAKMMHSSGYGLVGGDADAIDWSVRMGASVLNNSWGYSEDRDLLQTNPALYNAIHSAATTGRGGKGAVVLFASGNEWRQFSSTSLESHPDIITVGAITYRDQRSYYSNYGENLHVVAPSNGSSAYAITTTDITGTRGYNNDSRYNYSTNNNNYTNTFGGTSSATPLVSGLVGLMISENNDLTALDVKRILKDTAVKITVADESNLSSEYKCSTKVGAAYDSNGHSICMGYGKINAKLTLQYVHNMNGCTPNAAGEICNNNIDDDCDALIDSADPDCNITNVCEGVNCVTNSTCAPYDDPQFPDGYACFCDEGYKVNTAGDACVPLTCDDLECNAHAHCDSTDIICVCDTGYALDSVTSTCISTNPCEGVTCADWEECSTNTGICNLKDDRCSANVDCGLNYICNENHECIAINLCAGITCSNHGSCSIVNNSPICNCDNGYHTDGTTCIQDTVNLCTGINCEEWESCNENSGNCELKDNFCYQNSDCDSDSSCNSYHRCISNSGVCDGVTCSNHGTCIDNGDQPECMCDIGFNVINLTCIANNPCLDVTCSNYGTCEVIDGSASCDCFRGYHPVGLECMENSDPCEGITCNNHGSCEVTNNSASCNCDINYHSDNLECIQDITNPCEGVSCSNHGSCEVINSSASCNCDTNYYDDGLNCIAYDNVCTDVNCNNHGTCINDNGFASCLCDAGYYENGLNCKLEEVNHSGNAVCSYNNDSRSRFPIIFMVFIFLFILRRKRT